MSIYNCFGHWGHFYILENLDANLRRVFAAIWGEWLSGLCDFDQRPLGTQLGLESQPLRVNFEPKLDSPKCSD